MQTTRISRVATNRYGIQQYHVHHGRIQFPVLAVEILWQQSLVPTSRNAINRMSKVPQVLKYRMFMCHYSCIALTRAWRGAITRLTGGGGAIFVPPPLRTQELPVRFTKFKRSKFKLVWHQFRKVQFSRWQFVWKARSVQFGDPGPSASIQFIQFSSFSSVHSVQSTKSSATRCNNMNIKFSI